MQQTATPCKLADPKACCGLLTESKATQGLLYFLHSLKTVLIVAQCTQCTEEPSLAAHPLPPSPCHLRSIMHTGAVPCRLHASCRLVLLAVTSLSLQGVKEHLWVVGCRVMGQGTLCGTCDAELWHWACKMQLLDPNGKEDTWCTAPPTGSHTRQATLHIVLPRHCLATQIALSSVTRTLVEPACMTA
jgi:hypothetical protein